jgi:hypothetical protein
MSSNIDQVAQELGGRQPGVLAVQVRGGPSPGVAQSEGHRNGNRMVCKRSECADPWPVASLRILLTLCFIVRYVQNDAPTILVGVGVKTACVIPPGAPDVG